MLWIKDLLHIVKSLIQGSSIGGTQPSSGLWPAGHQAMGQAGQCANICAHTPTCVSTTAPGCENGPLLHRKVQKRNDDAPRDAKMGHCHCLRAWKQDSPQGMKTGCHWALGRENGTPLHHRAQKQDATAPPITKMGCLCAAVRKNRCHHAAGHGNGVLHHARMGQG